MGFFLCYYFSSAKRFSSVRAILRSVVQPLPCFMGADTLNLCYNERTLLWLVMYKDRLEMYTILLNNTLESY